MTEAERIVRAYLAAMEARDAATARGLVSQDAEMIFPGGRRPASVEDIFGNSGSRYRRIGKHIEGCDVAHRPGGAPGDAVVYCYGTLHGLWPDGEPFEGIRFVDRLEIAGGRIVSQWVWNDAGEARIAREDTE